MEGGPRKTGLIRRTCTRLVARARANPFEAAVTILAIVYFALALSPSSYGHALTVYGKPGEGLYLGSPRLARFDEWALQTPYVQAMVRTGFSALNTSSFYGETFNNLLPLPVMDWGFVFRPLFWGFAVLPAAWAYSLYWAGATWLAVVGWSLLLRRIGVRYVLAIAGSLAIFFAPFTQTWWTGITPLFALFPWIFICFTSQRKPITLVLPAAWVTASWLVSAFYLPGVVLLGFTGAILFFGFILRREELRRVVIVGVAVAAGGVVAIVYMAPLLRALADTEYPGRRVVEGGSLVFGQWMSQFSPLGVTRGYGALLPTTALPETTALGSWLPVLTIALLDFKRLRQTWTWRTGKPLVVLGVGFLLLTAWQLLDPFHWLGQLFFWNRSPEQRSLISSGILLSVASVWVLTKFPLTISRRRLLALVGLMLFVTLLTSSLVGGQTPGAEGLLYLARDNLVTIGVGAALVLLMVIGFSLGDRAIPFSRASVLALSVVLPAAVVWAIYNPVQSTRPIFEPMNTAVTQALDRVAQVRSDQAIAANYPGATLNGLGYRSVVHILMLPQLDTFRRMFPDMEETKLRSIFDRKLDLLVYDGDEPLARGQSVLYLPRSTVRRLATVTSLTPNPPPTGP